MIRGRVSDSALNLSPLNCACAWADHRSKLLSNTKIYLEILLSIKVYVGFAYYYAVDGVSESGVGSMTGAGGGSDGVEYTCAAFQRYNVWLVCLAYYQCVTATAVAAHGCVAKTEAVV